MIKVGFFAFCLLWWLQISVACLQKAETAAQQPEQQAGKPQLLLQLTPLVHPTSVHHSLKTEALGFVFQR